MGIRLSDHFTYKKLLRFVLPSIAMMVFISVYGVVDGFFVSNFAGKTSFAAINLVMPFVMLLGGIGFMVGTGGTALVSKVLGEGDREKANRYFSMMVFLTLLLGVLLTAVGIAAMEPVARFLGATDAMIADSVLYGRIVVGFTAAFMLQNVFQSFLIAAEKPKLGLLATIAAGLTNILLDALFVGGFGWGVAGAAIATGISQCVGGLLPLFYFLRPNDSLLRLVRTKPELAPLVKACTNGSSELMSSISSSVVSMVYNHQLLEYIGEDGVSAYGVLMYVQFIFVAIYIGYSVGCAPVIGYHYGAGNRGRAEEHAAQKRAADRVGRRPADAAGAAACVAAGLDLRRLRRDAARAHRARVPPVLLLLPALGLQHLHLRLLHRAQQRLRLCGDLLPAHAAFPDLLRPRPACAVRHRRHLVGHHGGGGVRVCDFAHLPADKAEEIRLYVTPAFQNRILPFTGTRRAARPLFRPPAPLSKKCASRRPAAYTDYDTQCARRHPTPAICGHRFFF